MIYNCYIFLSGFVTQQTLRLVYWFLTCNQQACHSVDSDPFYHGSPSFLNRTLTQLAVTEDQLNEIQIKLLLHPFSLSWSPV